MPFGLWIHCDFKERIDELAQQNAAEMYENIPVLAEARAYYSGQITNMEAEVYRIAGQNSPLKAEIDTEFEELDRMFTELKADLKDNAANEEVIEAMIQNYRVKLDILYLNLIPFQNLQTVQVHLMRTLCPQHPCL